jgi:hypothetical protein
MLGLRVGMRRGRRCMMKRSILVGLGMGFLLGFKRSGGSFVLGRGIVTRCGYVIRRSLMSGCPVTWDLILRRKGYVWFGLGVVIVGFLGLNNPRGVDVFLESHQWR